MREWRWEGEGNEGDEKGEEVINLNIVDLCSR